jgi:hypothetical protein
MVLRCAGLVGLERSVTLFEDAQVIRSVTFDCLQPIVLANAVFITEEDSLRPIDGYDLLASKNRRITAEYRMLLKDRVEFCRLQIGK